MPPTTLAFSFFRPSSDASPPSFGPLFAKRFELAFVWWIGASPAPVAWVLLIMLTLFLWQCRRPVLVSSLKVSRLQLWKLLVTQPVREPLLRPWLWRPRPFVTACDSGVIAGPVLLFWPQLSLTPWFSFHPS